MYLTRIDDVLGDDYEAHRRVRSLFEKGRVLFQRKGYEIIVLSENPIAQSEDVSSVIENIANGDRFLFRLRANACVTKSVGGKNRRVGLPPGRHAAWLESVFMRNGFKADFVHRSEGLRRSIKRGMVLSLASVLATGVLTVEDAAKFRAAVIYGIGHGKGLGFGLLNIFDVM